MNNFYYIKRFEDGSMSRPEQHRPDSFNQQVGLYLFTIEKIPIIHCFYADADFDTGDERASCAFLELLTWIELTMSFSNPRVQMTFLVHKIGFDRHCIVRILEALFPGQNSIALESLEYAKDRSGISNDLANALNDFKQIIEKRS